MKLYRCRFDRKIFGVCGGLGRFLKIDPNLIRLAFVLISLLTAVIPLVVCYLVAGLLIPQGPLIYLETSNKRLFRLSSGKVVSGLCAGLAQYAGLDRSLVRLAVALAACFTFGGPIIITYLIGSLIVPEKKS